MKEGIFWRILKLIVEYVTHYLVLGINLNSDHYLASGLNLCFYCIGDWFQDGPGLSELLVVVFLLFENPQSRPITDNRNISSKKIMCEIWS